MCPAWCEVCLFKPSTGGCFSFVIYCSSGSQMWRKHLLLCALLPWNCHYPLCESCQLHCFLDLCVIFLLNTLELKEIKTKCSCNESDELLPALLECLYLGFISNNSCHLFLASVWFTQQDVHRFFSFKTCFVVGFFSRVDLAACLCCVHTVAVWTAVW